MDTLQSLKQIHDLDKRQQMQLAIVDKREAALVAYTAPPKKLLVTPQKVAPVKEPPRG